MADDRLKMPPQRDLGFYQRRKHDKWRQVPEPDPALEAPVADSHAHLHMLPDPAWELVRCAAHRVDLVCSVADPSEDAMEKVMAIAAIPDGSEASSDGTGQPLPEVLLTLGVHPHNARLYTDGLERQLEDYLQHPKVRVLGEIGLDYHYDLSPRDMQREVFRRQIRLAKRLDMPIALHLRGGADPENDDAHKEAFEILQQEGFPAAGTLLHCCALGPDALKPWIQADCYIAYGGALTFKNAEEARLGARTVPADRLLLETDSPYMTPEPMRGAACTPAHILFTAECLAAVRGVSAGGERKALLGQVFDNTQCFFGGRV